ncbi:MAG: long-chain fatty acid--CoA ligase [bacterium]|nr:long-chain fatty acid--CoA ligase [bacterium]
METLRLFDLLPRFAEKFNKPDMLAAKVNGKWVKHSSSEVTEMANLISYGLLQMGINIGDRISIIANNRPEWIIANMGLMEAGAINVPIYPTISETDLVYILNDVEVKYVFVSNKEMFDKVNNVRLSVPSIIKIFSFDKIEGVNYWTEIIELGNKFHNNEKLEQIKQSITPTDIATILYTSGTTGNPKGVMLSHHNLISNAVANQDAANFNPEWKALSFLPLNHVFERMLTILYLYKGVSIYYAESMEKISDNIKEVQPQCFATVPRLLEKVYDKIVAKGHEQKGIKKLMFFWALNLGLRYELNGANGWWYEFQLKIANKLVFVKWREALGGNIKGIISGGAALQPRLARVFTAAQIPILEGYGLTETSPVIAVNNFRPNSICFGTVGPIIEGVEVKFASDGEILVKGPNVMKGYYKREKETKEVIVDGWFHTGDIGELIENRFLKITDRKKEIFKTSGGKFIAPQIIENKLKESPFIEQVMIIGESQRFPAALIVPSFAYLKEWCLIKDIEFTSYQNIIKNEKVVLRYQKEVEKVNKNLSNYEMIKKFKLMPLEWTIDSGEMTPKLSLKRNLIAKNNQTIITEIYNSKND